MESWHPVLEFLWRLLLLPILALFAIAVVARCLGLELTIFIAAVVVVNLIAYAFEEHKHRIKTLEDQLERLLDRLHDAGT